jgi:porin
MSMVGLRLSRAFVTAATVSLVVLAAQWLPVSADAGDTLLDNFATVRSSLDKYGISLGLQSTDEVFGNPNGGKAQGATFFGQIALGLGIDLDKAIDLKGGIFNITAYQTYGHGISASNIDNLSLVSNIEATRSARLFELWYQQSVFGGAADVRLGQLAADQEFIITQYGAWFINSAFGWPTLPSVDLPAGGPQYPLATPAIRLRVKPVEPLTLLFAAFNGNPAGPGLGNPELRDSSGTLFRFGDGVFTIAEAQWAIDGGKTGGGGPITLRVGGWYHDKATPNQFFATDGLTAVSPASPGSPIPRQDWSGYAVADVMLLPGPNGKGGLAIFGRVEGAPAQRSKVSAELAAGIVYQGPFGRESDNFGLAVDSARVGDSLGTVGALASQFTFHGNETVLELSYQAQALPWLQVAAGYTIRPQPWRRHTQSEPAAPACWQRCRIWLAHRCHILILCAN